jgi:hypothetical protein
MAGEAYAVLIPANGSFRFVPFGSVRVDTGNISTTTMDKVLPASEMVNILTDPFMGHPNKSGRRGDPWLSDDPGATSLGDPHLARDPLESPGLPVDDTRRIWREARDIWHFCQSVRAQIRLVYPPPTRGDP